MVPVKVALAVQLRRNGSSVRAEGNVASDPMYVRKCTQEYVKLTQAFHIPLVPTCPLND